MKDYITLRDIKFSMLPMFFGMAFLVISVVIFALAHEKWNASVDTKYESCHEINFNSQSFGYKITMDDGFVHLACKNKS